jgi:uncharacterized protein
MSVLDECLIRSALGDRPEEIHFNWRPIYEPTDAEKASLGKTTAEIITALGATGLFLEEVLAEAGANAMIETGALPGLEAAVEKYGIGIDGDEEDEIAAEVAAGAAQDMADAAARTLYVKRNVMNADDLISWAKSQGFKSTLPADDLHVTVAFSRTPLDWMKVGESWEETIEVPAGGPRLMEKFGEARVLLFSSGSLKYRHEQIIEAGASWDHPEYQPHITISYGADAPDLADIEPYTGKIILGPEVFAEVDLGWSEKIVEE